MICQASYDSLDAVPEEFRDEFEQKKGKWVLKEDAIPGVGPLFNPGLADNAEKSLKQVKARNQRISELETENTRLQDKVDALDGGGEVLSKEDGKAWKDYTALGTPKEVKRKLDEHGKLAETVAQLETVTTITKVAEAVASSGVTLNGEVLQDWLQSPESKNFSVFLKEIEQVDDKGNKTRIQTPHVRVEQVVDGKTQVTEKELLPFAEETMPAWKYQALITTADNSNGGKPVTKPSGVKLPNLGPSDKKPVPEQKERPVDRFNKQRAEKPNPFLKPAVVVPGAIPTVR